MTTFITASLKQEASLLADALQSPLNTYEVFLNGLLVYECLCASEDEAIVMYRFNRDLTRKSYEQRTRKFLANLSPINSQNRFKH